MKILVTGRTGQLGSDLAPRLEARGHDVLAPPRATLDLGWPAERIGRYVTDSGCDWLVNCAAMTAVDRCEHEAALAMRLNRDAPRALATACAAAGARLLQVSTDYVFSGRKNSPYTEVDETGPINVYGHSKLAGERAALEALPAALILRTSWVYGIHGNNFVKTILRKAAAGDGALRVVDDQVGVPTWTQDICVAIAHLIEADASGIYHYASDGVCSWYEFAAAIVEEAVAAGFDLASPTVEPISTAQAKRLFGTSAQRPAYSVLDNTRIRTSYLDDARASPPHWRASLRRMLALLAHGGGQSD